jgi:hypothetical protein
MVYVQVVLDDFNVEEKTLIFILIWGLSSSCRHLWYIYKVYTDWLSTHYEIGLYNHWWCSNHDCTW